MRVGTSFLALLSLLPLLLSLQFSSAQLPADTDNISSRTLDAILQDCAFKAFLRPKTGVPYDGKVPRSLNGIRVSAMRLRSGSLRTRGVESYKEFQIPIGVFEQPYVERLVFVYHNLGNWSEKFYPLPGYIYLAPVLGLMSYSGANLSDSELPELDIRASDKPILIKFPHVESAPLGSVPTCVYFDLHGSVQFDILLHGNVCSTFQQGHLSIVVESNAPSPAPAAVAVAADVGRSGSGRNNSMVWIIVASLVGGCFLLIMLSLLVAKVRRTRQGMKIQQLEWAAESNETLQIASIGGTKAPLAIGTRTRPTIENDYIP
uniref:Malectin-like domain-containing protein n=1 Tax=Glycine max TaxID=3847 RepID=C6TMK4_SOYBN|nr:unknown [Glycine max]